MCSSLATILHDVVLGSSIPAKALAIEIGKPYSTLLREANPYDGGAKLGAETMFEIIKRTRNVAPLQYMAEQLGYALVETDVRRPERILSNPPTKHVRPSVM